MADQLSLGGLGEGSGTKGATPGSREAQNWLAQIASAKGREKKYKEYARKLWDIYEANTVTENSFNILYSNTETLQPAVFGAVPRPRVRAKWEEEAPLKRQAAEALERMLTSLSDPGSAQFSPFASLVESAVTGCLVAGRGLTKFRYEPSFAEAPAGLDLDEDEDPAVQNEPTPSNEVVEAPAAVGEVLERETVVGDDIPFDRIVFGFATTWTDLPWVAIEYAMSEKDVEANFGAEIAKLMVYGGGGEDDKRRRDDNGQEEVVKASCVYGVWHKASRTVIYVSEGLNDRVLKRVRDPLGLSGFYPFPEQLTFFLKAESLTPVPLYKFYEQQAKELNRVSARINKVLSVIKARGLYDDTIKGMADLADADDGKMIAAKGVAALLQNGTLEKSLWMWPADKLIVVLQQLYIQRQQTKQVIYEITGISDILRGASVASETATAQTIKNQWGSLRLRFAQARVSLYARNCFRVIGEIAVRRFGEETWRKATGLPYLSSAEKMELEQTLKEVAASGMQPTEEQMPVLQEMQGKLQEPSWGDILKELNENVENGYSVDVETNSTLDADATEDKKDMADLLGALAQIFQSLGPAVQSGAIPMAAAKAILIGAMERYRFGDKVMEALEQMPTEQPQQGADGKGDAAAQKAQAEVAVLQEKAKIEQQSAQMDLQMKEKELQFKEKELEFKMEEAQAKHELTMMKISDQRMESQQKAQMRAQQAAMAAAAPAGMVNPQGPGPMAGMQPQGAM